MGEYFLQVTPGYLGDDLTEGDQILHVDYDVAPAELMKDLKGISKNVVVITESLKNVIGSESGQEKLSQILESFESVAVELSRAVGDNAKKFDTVVDNVVAITADARGFTGNFECILEIFLWMLEPSYAT